MSDSDYILSRVTILLSIILAALGILVEIRGSLVKILGRGILSSQTILLGSRRGEGS